MTRNRRIAAALVAFALVAFAATWLWASPMWTLSGMRDAARTGDAASLDAHIDYPALRENIKAQLVERIRQAAPQGPGAELALALGSGMVDSMVTPQRLREMIAGTSARPDSDGLMNADDVGIERTGLTGFVAGTKRDGQVTGGAVFALQGVTWRIVGIRIPQTAGPGATVAPPPTEATAPAK